MKRTTYIALGCCCMMLGGIIGCRSLESDKSQKRAPTSASPSASGQGGRLKAEVITNQEEIRVRPVGASHTEDANRNPCTSKSARAIAQAYVLSMPMSNEKISLKIDKNSAISRYVESNRDMFESDGEATLCARAFGAHIVSLGKESYGSSTDMTKAIIAKWGGPAVHNAAKAADTIQSYGASMFTLGDEMQWLAKVLPQVANGNYSTYNAAKTTYRTALRETTQAMAAADGRDKKAAIENMADMVNATANQYLEQLEESIITLAGTLTTPASATYPAANTQSIEQPIGTQTPTSQSEKQPEAFEGAIPTRKATTTSTEKAVNEESSNK